jgi:hypothetical protein
MAFGPDFSQGGAAYLREVPLNYIEAQIREYLTREFDFFEGEWCSATGN